MPQHRRTILRPEEWVRSYWAATLVASLALAVAPAGCQPEPEPEPPKAPEPIPEPVVEAPPPPPPKPPEPEVGEAHYINDTPWAPGAEGKLMQGLDGGRYEPYRARLVRDAQRALFRRKLYDGPVTGVLDKHTMEAVGELQKQNGLKASGVLTPRTRDVLDKGQGDGEGPN